MSSRRGADKEEQVALQTFFGRSGEVWGVFGRSKEVWGVSVRSSNGAVLPKEPKLGISYTVCILLLKDSGRYWVGVQQR